jgi:hypothetical protein
VKLHEKQRMAHMAFWLLTAIAVALLAIAGCKPVPASAPTSVPQPGAGFQGTARTSVPIVHENFKIEVSVSHLPKPNESFTLIGKFTPMKQDEADAELWIHVEGGVYLDGEDRWHGPLKLGEEKVISATFALVTEGKHEINAAAYSTDRVREEGIPILVLTTIGSSEWYQGAKPGQGPPAPIIAAGDVPAGHNTVVETAMLLNDSSEPIIEFIQRPSDIVRLQEQGLLPKELRYRWRKLGTLDFSKHFLIAYFDSKRPTPGYLPVFLERGFTWDNGTLRGGNYKTHIVPPDVSRASKPVSSVVIRALAWQQRPFGIEAFAFQGLRSFEFTIDNRPPIVKTITLQPGP